MNVLWLTVANVLATFDPPDPPKFGYLRWDYSAMQVIDEPSGTSPLLYVLFAALLGVATWFGAWRLFRG